jgi:hypothetical protein
MDCSDHRRRVSRRSARQHLVDSPVSHAWKSFPREARDLARWTAAGSSARVVLVWICDMGAGGVIWCGVEGTELSKKSKPLVISTLRLKLPVPRQFVDGNPRPPSLERCSRCQWMQNYTG